VVSAAIVAAGVTSGLAVFYWWAEWGRGFGAFFVNSAALVFTVLTLFLIAMPLTWYCYLTKNTKKQKARRSTLLMYFAGWLIALPLGLLMFPADSRHFPSPPQVTAMAKVLQQQLAKTQAPWGTRFPERRTRTTFALAPASKTVGLMPSGLPIAEWHSFYADGSSAKLRYSINGLEPPILISAQFEYAEQVQRFEDPQALARHIVTKPATAPWSWVLPVPEQPPTNITAKDTGNNGILIKANYSGEVLVIWSRSQFLGNTIENLTYHAPALPLPCREPWQRIRICLPPLDD